MGEKQRFLVTGGIGFIGSHLVDLLMHKGHQVIVLDALSWGSNMRNLSWPGTKIVGGLSGQRGGDIPDGDLVIVVGNVADTPLVQELVDMTDGVFHLAAETHVDRSYGDVKPFVNSNIVGAYSVLEAVRKAKFKKRCIFVSTDEVYGDIPSGFSSETDPLAPRNIYACLKAGGDLLAQTYAGIFNLDVLIARPANNYGPRQFEEKLIPKILTNYIRQGDKARIPVYGDGKQIRDWLFVRDTAKAFWAMFEKGKAGQIYNLPACWSYTVLDVIMQISEALDRDWRKHVDYLPDRIRGDRRYAMSPEKASLELDWKATTNFHDGLKETIEWYREHLCPTVQAGV